MRLVIASNNKNKIKEIKLILSPYFEEILSLNEANINHETIEDGKTFIDNAEKKAREIAEIGCCYAIADDSGLCVDALDGAPGVYSARFCGEHGNDEKNNDVLLEKMQGVTNRAAHYACAIALVAPNGYTLLTEDYLYGEILTERRGNGGFGYDPLFFIPELNKTLAEITLEEKNTLSHRAKALNNILNLINDSKKDICE